MDALLSALHTHRQTFFADLTQDDMIAAVHATSAYKALVDFADIYKTKIAMLSLRDRKLLSEVDAVIDALQALKDTQQFNMRAVTYTSAGDEYMQRFGSAALWKILEAVFE